ncbi:MAG: hypothetical protein DRH12_17865 [Deltaproteobacteria bacterium]|nr:MAG: hypothetical protein DRH12_17865 [Deltaproteobacteria bacterium]
MVKWSSSSFMDFLTGDLSSLDRNTSSRIRTVTSFFLVLALLTPPLGIFYRAVGISKLSTVCFAASGLAVLGLILGRKGKNPDLTANFGIFTLWGLLVIIRWETGAMSVPGPELLSWVWNTVLILVAVYFAGFLWGSIWASLVFVESGFAALLYKTGHNIERAIPQGMAASYGLGAYLLALLAVLVICFLIEKERRELAARDQEQAEMIEGSRRYVENLISKTPVPMFVIDKNYRVVQWNRACQELSGITPNNIIGRGVWKGFATERGQSLAEELVGDPDGFKERYKDKIISASDSGTFVLEISLPYLEGGEKVLVSAAPITDREGEIKGAIQCIQRLAAGKPDQRPYTPDIDGLENSPCAIFVIDRKGKVSLWNMACERRFGHSKELMEGRSPTNLVAKKFRLEFREAVSSVLRGQTLSSKEFKYYNADGDPVYVRAELFPLREDSGNVVGCVIINTDVTDLKIRTAMLQRALIQNKERLRTLTEEYNLLKKNIASFIRRKEGEKRESKESE